MESSLPIQKDDIVFKNLDTGINNQDDYNCGVVICMQMHWFLKKFQTDVRVSQEDIGGC